MKKIIYKFSLPYYYFLRRVLFYLKPICINEGPEVCKRLEKLGFFKAVVVHPSIIFGQTKTTRQVIKSKRIRLTLWFVKINITMGLLNNRIGRITAQKAGIHPAFAKDMHRLLDGNNNDYIEYSFKKRKNSYKKVAVYSALTGGYDTLWEPIVYSHQDTQVDFILFTDNPELHSNKWEIRYLQDTCNPALLSRKIRMFPHRLLPEYDVCIYVDASMFVYGDIAQLSSLVSNETPFAITRHPSRASVREEIIVFANRMNIDHSVAERQYNIYLNEGFRDNIPLTENGLFVVKNNVPQLNELLEAWYTGYRDCLLPSDQIPLQPAMSRLHFNNYILLDGSVWCNQFLMVLPHKTRLST